MKKDAIKSLEEIRALCNSTIAQPESYYDKNPRLLFIRIEWICRHALENYEEANDG